MMSKPAAAGSSKRPKQEAVHRCLRGLINELLRTQVAHLTGTKSQNQSDSPQTNELMFPKAPGCSWPEKKQEWEEILQKSGDWEKLKQELEDHGDDSAIVLECDEDLTVSNTFPAYFGGPDDMNKANAIKLQDKLRKTGGFVTIVVRNNDKLLLCYYIVLVRSAMSYYLRAGAVCRAA
jgi:hypothetical protein